MRSNCFVVLTACSAVLLSSRALAADNPLVGEWFPVKTSDGGLGGTRHFKTNGTVIVTFGAALHFKYQLETNGVTNTVLMPGPKGPDGPPMQMDFAITNDTLTLNERKGRQRDRLTRVKGTSGEGLFGQWTGKHYTGGQQIMDFTTNLYGYLSVPFQTVTGSFTLNGNRLTEEYQGKRVTSRWKITNDVLTLTPSTGDQPEKYRRKGAAFAGDETAFSDKAASANPETEKIEALLKHLESLKDASFIRNDKALQPGEAATLMRRKWEAQDEDIKSATEFIEKIMTASSSGARKPYLIRFKDGKETKCADYLKAELEKLEAATPKTARAPRDDWKPVAQEPAILSNMELVWSVSLGTNRLAGGVASDPNNGVVYALSPAFKGQKFKICLQISADGKVERQFNKESNMEVRSFRLHRDGTRGLLFFSHWVGDLVATDTNGVVLWTILAKDNDGTDDVWAADLDGDELDEVIIGYNGSTGLHVLDGRGKLLWKNQQEGNVWHVCAADLEGDGKPEVISTSARGKVRVFKGDGTRLPDIEPPPGYYGDLVRPVKLSESGRAEGILLTGAKNKIAALKGDGTLAWEAALGTSAAGQIAEPAPGKPWVAIPSGDRLLVLDTQNGSIIAQAGKRGRCHLCWLEMKGQSSPLLIVSTSQTVEAYRVKE